MEERIDVYRVLMEKPEGERDHSDDLGLDGMSVLKLIFKNFFRRHWVN
jgi:hypothetical protein